MNSPTVRVVERSGTKIIEEVGNNNPWKKEWACPRADCLPCQGQVILASEAKEEAVKLVCGEEGKEGTLDGVSEGRKDNQGRKKSAEERKSLTCCTKEGCNYIIECLTCRKAGAARRYFGETSRSP